MKTAEITDKELIEKCRGGDEHAFGILYQRYRLRMFSYIVKLMPGKPDLVDDIFQQTWFKAIRNWDKYDDRECLLAWLCRISHNLIMDFYRSQKHRTDEELADHDAIAASDDAQGQLEKRELAAALEVAIDNLPDNQKTVVELRRKGLSFNEIASLQDSTLNTVLGRMHYAVLKLREVLKDYL
ncbi:MAG: sigma-70 family RNA polymerase sigma factor [Victivallales bacterium]|nr:sigma-70 family RNA polymerase sigma factor [Victivallales bacterium]